MGFSQNSSSVRLCARLRPFRVHFEDDFNFVSGVTYKHASGNNPRFRHFFDQTQASRDVGVIFRVPCIPPGMGVFVKLTPPLG